jgi:hypothetical protein
MFLLVAFYVVWLYLHEYFDGHHPKTKEGLRRIRRGM